MGEQRNPSDPASYGLDPKTATLRLKFRVVQVGSLAQFLHLYPLEQATLSVLEPHIWVMRYFVSSPKPSIMKKLNRENALLTLPGFVAGDPAGEPPCQ